MSEVNGTEGRIKTPYCQGQVCKKKKKILQVLLTKVRVQYASAKRFLLVRNGTQVPLLFLTCKAVLKKVSLVPNLMTKKTESEMASTGLIRGWSPN